MPKHILDKVPFLKKHICATCNYVHKHRKTYLFASFVLALVSIVFSALITSINPEKTFAGAGGLIVTMHTQEAPDDVDVALADFIGVLFDQNLDGVGATGIVGKIQVVPAGGDPIDGALSFDDGIGPTRAYIFTPTVDLLPETVYTVTVTGGLSGVVANSGADTMLDDYSWSFTTVAGPDVTGPTVSSATVNDLVAAPLTLTTVSPFVDQVATAPSLQINFDEPIANGTVGAASAYLSYVNSLGATVVITGTWNVFGGIGYDYMTFTPTAGLKQNTEYTITLTTSIIDEAPAANAMASLGLPGEPTVSYRAKFLTTGDYSDSIPTITSQYPADLEGGIAIPAASIDVDFDQPINPATVDGAIAVYESDGTPVPGTTEIDPTDGSIIHFTPTSVNWLADTSYSVALSGGDSGINNVRNVNFTTLGSDVLYWTFHTTAPYPADAVPPYVFIAGSNINSNGMSGVAANLGSITIPFEENDLMDVGTINSTNIYLLDQDVQVEGTTVGYDYETTTATLTIPALDVCTQYTIHVDNDIQDARGNGVWDLILPATDAEWIFYTLCTTPVVTSVTPADEATDVATDATVTVVFDQPISNPVFYGSNVVISTSIDGSNSISIQDISMNGDNTGFVITQAEEGLVAGTLYYIILDEISPANDTSPTYKIATTTYSFTTAGTAPVEEEEPAVVVAPVGGGPLITRTTKKPTTTSPTTTTTTPSTTGTTGTTGTTTTSSTPLKDIAGHWAESYIENLYERGIVSGNLDGNYNPDAPITRAEFTKIIVGLYDIPMQDQGSFTSIFKDVNLSKWYAVYVQAAYDDGIIEGYTQNTFSPDKPITRAEAIKVVLEGAGAIVPELDADTTFKDVTKEDWFAKYVKYAVDNGIVNGYADGTFGGEKSITRAEVAKIADVMLKNEIITRVMRILR